MSDDVIADLAQASALLSGLTDCNAALNPTSTDAGVKLDMARRLIDDVLVDLGRVFDVDVVV